MSESERSGWSGSVGVDDRLTRFAEWAASLTRGDLPESVAALARTEFYNNVAAGMIGFEGDAGSYTRRLRAAAGAGPCSAFGTGGLDPVSACYVNAVCSMAHDFDDYLFMGHAGHSAVFASLAAAEYAGRDGGALLTAIVVANELAGRLGAACSVGPHNGQMWSFIHQAGAAAAASWLFDADADGIRDAVAGALYQIPHPTEAGFMQGASKYTTAAQPAAAGLRCALFADAGAPGAGLALEGEGGLLETYPHLPLAEMLDGWGESWVTRSLCVKPKPGCAYLQSVLENVDELRAELEAFDGVDAIEVRASLPTLLMDALASAYLDRPETELSPVGATFSVSYGIAVAIVGDGLDARTLTEEFLVEHRTEIEAVAERVELHHDWGHTADVIEGVTRGIDIGPLLSGRPRWAWFRALSKVGATHARTSVRSRLFESIDIAALRRAIRGLDSPLDWDDFRFGAASFGQVSFDFGSTISCRRGTRRYTVSRSAHRGASCDSVGARRELVRDKLETAARTYFGESNRADTWVDELAELEPWTSADAGEMFRRADL